MPRSENQKFKILYLMQMLLERTDGSHIITMQEILAELARHGVAAERKSIYHDIGTLRRFGMEIEVRKGPPAGYCLVSREFNLPELKLLVDAVRTCRFCTAESGDGLLQKLARLASCHDAAKLCRPVYTERAAASVAGRLCSNVDKIHEAMAMDSHISFRYFVWNVDKEPKLKRNGGQYLVSPWKLLWVREHYHLVACEAGGKKLKFYRVDKMMDVELTGEPREGRAVFEAFDAEAFAQRSFGMPDGRETVVTLRMDNALADAVVDRFGMDVPMRPVDKDTFRVKLPVVPGPQFYGWLAGLGRGARLVSPQEEAENYRKYLKRLLKENK